jgi:sugar phosphate isomerase/epimerase
MSRFFSLAHLSLIDTSPADLIRIATEAGYDLVDLRLAPATPTDPAYSSSELAALARDLAPMLRDAGLRVWDVEIVRINDHTQPQNYLPLMEAASHLGASRMKLVCDTDNHARAAQLLAELAQLAAPFGLTLDLEYMVFSGVKSLKAALGVVEAAAQPNLRVLVDALHWARAGDTADDIRAANRLDYVQLCDAPATAPVGREALIVEARTNRLAPGEGALALGALLDAMPPACVASLEVPLSPGRAPLAHARTLLAAARTVCASHDRVAS